VAGRISLTRIRPVGVLHSPRTKGGNTELLQESAGDLCEMGSGVNQALELENAFRADWISDGELHVEGFHVVAILRAMRKGVN